MVCDWFSPQIGGIENHIADLARELDARGHEVHVITSTPGPSWNGRVRVHRLDVARLPRWNVVATPAANARVRALCEREHFELIHAHSLQSPLAHLAMHVARSMAIPSVLTQHSVLGPSARWLLRRLPERWTCRPDVFTAVSSVAARATEIATGRNDVQVVHTGLDLSRWIARRSPGDGVPTVVTVTRLFAHKRTEDLVAAIPRVLDELGRPRALRFVIVGDGPERRKLERMAARLGVAGWTSFAGALPRGEVARVLERSHVFVLPNPGEAFGIAALEARALGLPVVARSQSGACDLIEHGRHGYLCETIDDMAHAIAGLCRDEVARRAMARRAREGLDAFGWPAAIERHLAIYELACGAPARVLRATG